MAVAREVLADGQIRLAADECTFTFRRLRPGALLVTIVGQDDGQFGNSTLDEIRMELLRHKPLELFIDTREATGAAVSVSDDWTRFFSMNAKELTRVSVLVSSQLVQLTVAVAQHLSRTGKLIQIYSDPETFDGRVAAALSE